MASTRSASPPGLKSRLSLAALTLAGLAMLVWLVADLARAAFG